MIADMDIAISTWPNAPFRFGYFIKTIQALQENLTASRHGIRWVCSAETQPDPDYEWMGPQLSEFCKSNDIELHWRNDPPNLGANMNAALKLCTGLTIWTQQDDWLLLRPVDVSPGIDFILDHSEFDLLRYSYPDVDRMRPRFHPISGGGLSKFREVDRNSTWFYGDDPHIRRPEFMDQHGWYLEGGAHASASQDLMRRLKQKRARIAVTDQCYFQHFGQTSSYPRGRESREGRRR